MYAVYVVLYEIVMEVSLDECEIMCIEWRTKPDGCGSVIVLSADLIF